jgi:hypothetical protein
MDEPYSNESGRRGILSSLLHADNGRIPPLRKVVSAHQRLYICDQLHLPMALAIWLLRAGKDGEMANEKYQVMDPGFTTQC